MRSPPSARPTLWRSCRVLANRHRLRMLGVLVRETELGVSAVAQRLALPTPIASLYLRALEARGLLKVRRRGGRVSYRVPTSAETAASGPLLAALRAGFRRAPDFGEHVFRCATAFTHPRRVELYRALRSGLDGQGALCRSIKASRTAVVRHLGKLQARGFVRYRRGHWLATRPPDALSRALAQMAAD
jgi:DNA-binding MarR family transcriptional regulator